MAKIIGPVPTPDKIRRPARGRYRELWEAAEAIGPGESLRIECEDEEEAKHLQKGLASSITQRGFKSNREGGDALLITRLEENGHSPKAAPRKKVHSWAGFEFDVPRYKGVR